MGASKDDVDRLFACFKCGISPPQSAVRERPPRKGKKLRVASSVVRDGGGSSSASASTPEAGEKESEHKEPSSAAIKLKNRQQMSPIVFYGSPQGVPVKKPMSLLRLLREIHIDLKKETDLISRDVVWATFPRQDEAMRFSKEHAQTKVFSYQDHLSGQRRFLVSAYDEFWRRYNNMDPQIRHHYEVIQEGSPCHIYFDLEFNAKINQERDADEMVDILVAVTFSALHDKYSIEGQEEWIIELDSSNEVMHAFSTTKYLFYMWGVARIELCESREKLPFADYYLKVLAPKFSRHLIIRIPKTAFKDNSHVGAFVSEICSRIADQRAANPNLDKLYITKDSSCAETVDQLFVDTAVYSRNRCFRLAFSSKSGKKLFLMASGRFKCKNMNDKELFMESLICRLDDDCDKLLICKLDLECKKMLHFHTESSVPRIQGRNWPDAVDTYRSNFPQEYTYGRSPFPDLDGFIESIASFGSVSGKIRSWYWFSQYGLIIYSMSRSRYCEHIGREHKSNHVMYIVDFQRAAYYQKCYDPDCQGYRSPLRAVPWDVIPELSSTADSPQRDYQGKVVEINIEGSNGNEFLCDDNSVVESGEEDPSWWEEAVKFADSVQNADHAPAFCNVENDSPSSSRRWSSKSTGRSCRRRQNRRFHSRTTTQRKLLATGVDKPQRRLARRSQRRRRRMNIGRGRTPSFPCAEPGPSGASPRQRWPDPSPTAPTTQQPQPRTSST